MRGRGDLVRCSSAALPREWAWLGVYGFELGGVLAHLGLGLALHAAARLDCRKHLLGSPRDLALADRELERPLDAGLARLAHYRGIGDGLAVLLADDLVRD